MRATRDIMGMPVMVEIVGADMSALETVFEYLSAVDARFSTYKSDSEISRINRGDIQESEYSADMKEVFALAEKTHQESDGFFSIQRPDGLIDPSGLVKGWAIQKAAELVDGMGYQHYFLDVGGDLQSRGLDENGLPWTVGIRSPFVTTDIVKVLRPHGQGVATSGSYLRGQHIYNPHSPQKTIDDVVSLTVVGPNVYEADRFATAAFAMGRDGILFIEQLPGFEGYLIDREGIATMTSGLKHLLV